MTVVSAAACATADVANDGADSARLAPIMARDLNAYFTRQAGRPVRVEYAYLRRGPTVTGIAYPKYYLWIVARDASQRGVTAEGAARVAEIDSVIEVTHFFPKQYIGREPASLDSVFPPAVVAEIRKRQ
jgi:hypothetical protein